MTSIPEPEERLEGELKSQAKEEGVSGKTFGTFSGVFTPTILTILGVIVYLRLGWVVTQSACVFTIDAGDENARA